MSQQRRFCYAIIAILVVAILYALQGSRTGKKGRKREFALLTSLYACINQLKVQTFT